MTDASFYYDSLYPFQDAVLKLIRSVARRLKPRQG